MFSPDTNKILPHVKRRRGESPPKIGSGQILKETSIYRVQWHSYFPEKWLKDTYGGQNTSGAKLENSIISRGRITSQGLVIAFTQDEKDEEATTYLYIWQRNGKDICVFELDDMFENHLPTAPERVCPIFESSQHDDEAGAQLLGLAFVSSAGVFRFWTHYTDPSHVKEGNIPLNDQEVCTFLANAHIPNTLSLICGTSMGRMFLLRCTDANNTPCDAIVTEVVRPQGMITRIFRFSQQTSAVRRIINLQKNNEFSASSQQENGGTFVLTETSLSFWKLNENNHQHSFLWEDKLTNVLLTFPGAIFLDMVCRNSSSGSSSSVYELLVLCRQDTLCFVAVLDVFDSSSKPQLAQCIECTVPPREENENLRIVSVEGSVLAAFVIGALSVTNVPFEAVDGNDKDHVFNRVERKALSCLGGGVHDGAVYVLAEGYGVLTLQSLRPIADKHPRPRGGGDEDDEDEKKHESGEEDSDASRKLETAFGLYLDRTKTWEFKAQQLLTVSSSTLNNVIINFTQSLVQSRPKTEYTTNMDFAILRHHMVAKRTNFEEFFLFLQQSKLWNEKLSEQNQLLFLEMGEKLAITEKIWEMFQTAETNSTNNNNNNNNSNREEKKIRDNFLQQLVERTEIDGSSPMEAFFSDVLSIGNVILKLQKILPTDELEYGASEQAHAETLRRYLIANACVEIILWEGINYRQSLRQGEYHARLPVVAQPWISEMSIFAPLRDHAHKLIQLLQVVKSDEGLLPLRENLFASCYQVFRGCLSQRPQISRNTADFEQDVSYLVGLLHRGSETLESKDKATDLVISLSGEFLECAQLVYLCPVKSTRPMVTDVKEHGEEGDVDEAIHWHCLRSAEGFYYVNSATKQVTTTQPACFADDQLVEFLRSKCSASTPSHHGFSLTPLIALLHWFRPRNLGKFTHSLFISYIEKRRLAAVVLSVSDTLAKEAKNVDVGSMSSSSSSNNNNSSMLPSYPFRRNGVISDTQCAAVFAGAAKQLLDEYNVLLRAFLVNRRELAWLHAIHEKDFSTCTTALLDAAEDLSISQKNTRFNLAFLASRLAPAGTESDRMLLAQAQQYLSAFSQQQQQASATKRLRLVDGDARGVIPASPKQLFEELSTLGTSGKDAHAIVRALEIYQLLANRQEANADDLVQLWQSVYEVDQGDWQTIATARDNSLDGLLPEEQVSPTLFFQTLREWTQKTGRALPDVLLNPLKSCLDVLDPSVRRALDLVLAQPLAA